MRSRSVSVTGATGFLGWHVVQAFLDAGWQVRGIVRPGSRKPLPEAAERIEASLDVSSLTRASCTCEVVVHLAGLTRAARELEFAAVNVEGTCAAFEAAGAVGARLVLVSSQAAAGPGTPTHPAREDATPQPLTAYGRSKLMAEEVVRAAAGVPWIILRPSAVYGPRDRQFLPVFRLATHGIFPLIVDPETAFTFLYVEDAAKAVVAAANAQMTGETLFLGHAQPETTGAFLQSLARASGRTYRPIRVPRSLLRVAALAGEVAWRAGFQPQMDRSRLSEFVAEGFVCSVDRAREVLGFSASTPLREGVERTLRWYRDAGWI
jgi:nucleoside-diphosphate-sugar epimerase